MSDEETKIELIDVRMGLQPHTVEAISRYAELTQSKTKADAIARAIGLALLLEEEMKSGSTICSSRADGTWWDLFPPLADEEKEPG